MKLITINLPQPYLDGIERLVDAELYPNRSEAIRIALRDFVKKELNGLTFGKPRTLEKP